MSSNPRSVRIDFTHDLPPRPRPLAPEALAQVFGGCLGHRQPCASGWDCCSDLRCIVVDQSEPAYCISKGALSEYEPFSWDASYRND